MYHVSAQGADERLINVHYCYIIIMSMGQNNDINKCISKPPGPSFIAYVHNTQSAMHETLSPFLTGRMFFREPS